MVRSPPDETYHGKYDLTTFTQRDDERYPIPYTPAQSEHPEVAPNVPVEYYNGKYSTAPEAGERVEAGDKYSVPAFSQSTSPFNPSEATGPTSVGATQATRPKRICGLRRRTWAILLAIIVILVIVGAVVGGVVGSRSSKQSSSSSSIPASDRRLAMGSVQGTGNSKGDLQIFYNDLNSSDILYRLVWDDQAQAEQRAALGTSPRQGTPLALITSNGTAAGTVDVNLFYLSTPDASNTSSTIIMWSTLTCQRGQATCTAVGSANLGSSMKNGVDVNSGLTVVRDDAQKIYSLYYLGLGGFVRNLVGFNYAQNGWTDQMFGGPAEPGTDVVAFFIDFEQEIDVVYASTSGSLLNEATFNASTNLNGPYNTVTVSNTPASTKFTAVYESGIFEHHIFYIGANNSIYGFYRNVTATTWQSSHQQIWGTPVGGITSTNWANQLRLVYFAGSPPVLSVQARDNGNWLAVQAL